MKKSLKTGAFTLIEVLVVTAVVSLLASVVNASLIEARNEAQDKKKIEESKQVNTALEIQRNKTGSVPSVSSGSYVAHNERSSTYQNAMQELVDNNAMPSVPRSDSGEDYYYLVDDSGNGVFGAILRSDASISENNGCYFTEPDIGCSGPNANYTTEYDRESLVSKADDCNSDDSCGGVVATEEIFWEELPDLPLSVSKSWYTAEGYCNNLNHLGYDDWRLPTVDELTSLVGNNEIPNPSREPEYNWYFWSSDLQGYRYDGSEQMYKVDVLTGNLSYSVKSGSTDTICKR